MEDSILLYSNGLASAPSHLSKRNGEGGDFNYLPIYSYQRLGALGA